MTLTGAGDISVHESDDVVLIRGLSVPEVLPTSTAPVATINAYLDMYLRIVAATDEVNPVGTIILTNLYYWFNDATNAYFDAGRRTPIGYLEGQNTGLLIPQDFDGIVYFLLQFNPLDQSIAYAEELPTPAQGIYVRTLANVTRSGAGIPVVRQRCFGVVTIPGQQLNVANMGLF